MTRDHFDRFLRHKFARITTVEVDVGDGLRVGVCMVYAPCMEWLVSMYAAGG